MTLDKKEGSSTAESPEEQKLDSTGETEIELLSKETENMPPETQPKGDTEESQENINEELYKEVLEKLDLKPIENNQDIQEKSMQDKKKTEIFLNQIKNLEQAQMKKQIEFGISKDFEKIQKMMKARLINSAQGQNLQKQVLKKAFDKIVQTETIKQNLFTALNPNTSNNEKPIDENKEIEEFNGSDSEFFSSNGRQEVLNYLKSSKVNLGKDELNKISEIVKIVEKSAIDGYLKKLTYEKNLKESNETAKRKLTANAQKTSYSGTLSKTFTREQIGKMNSAEFTKYEPLIMKQLKKGLIK